MDDEYVYVCVFFSCLWNLYAERVEVVNFLLVAKANSVLLFLLSFKKIWAANLKWALWLPLTHFSLEQTYLYDMESAFEYPGNHFELYSTILLAHDVWNFAKTKDTSGHKPILGRVWGLDGFLGNKTSGK